MQYWDEVLFPPFLATIGGQRYSLITDAQLTHELENLAIRAIAAFLFPKQTLRYTRESSTVGETTLIRYAFSNDDITASELAVLIGWMKFFWAENQISNADNFVNLYFDANIKTFSPGNTIHNLVKFKEDALREARLLEWNYYRVRDGVPTLGEITEDE